MKRMYKLLLGFAAIAAMSVFMSCEGPAGPAGEDGVDGEVTCLACHAENTIVAIQAQFAQSIHRQGNFVGYAGSRSSCAQCHSHEGFIEYAEFGDVDGDITSPSAWECGTCHGLHTTFDSTDYALRMSDPVEFIFDGSTADMGGSSNLCANCHQSRRAEPSVTGSGDSFEITSIHYGPHHGAQSNVLYGAGFAEIAGSKSYPEAGSSVHMGTSCTGCHMAEYADAEGGHTWHPSLAKCNSCHTTDDFNYGGVMADVEEQLNTLRDLLLTAGVIEYVEADEAYKPVVGTHTMVEAQAFFNWIGLEEDRSYGVHNPKYVDALLTNSIEALQ